MQIPQEHLEHPHPSQGQWLGRVGWAQCHSLIPHILSAGEGKNTARHSCSPGAASVARQPQECEGQCKGGTTSPALQREPPHRILLQPRPHHRLCPFLLLIQDSTDCWQLEQCQDPFLLPREPTHHTITLLVPPAPVPCWKCFQCEFTGTAHCGSG